jgi:peptide/nickel transport system substrate-binding protein
MIGLAPSRRLRLLIGLVAISTFVFTGAASPGYGSKSSTAGGAPHSGGTLAIDAVDGGAPTLDPGSHAVLYASAGTFEMIYDSLFLPGPDEETYRPELVDHYTVNKAGTVYDLFIRHGVRFQDGTPLNAAAVVFNLNRDLQSKGCICNSTLGGVSSVQDVGPYEVQVSLKASDFTFISDITPLSLASFMASPTAVEKEGPEGFALHPVGAGPFKVESFVPNGPLTLEKSNDYWQKGKPYLSRIVITPTDDDTSGYEDLESGGAQMLVGAGPQVLAQAKGNSQVNIVNEAYPDGWTLWFNTSQPPFNNKTARLAIAYATDTKSIAAHVFPGWLHWNQSLIDPGEFGYTGPTVPGFPSYNLAKARQLVQQLGGLHVTFNSLGNTPYWETVMSALAQEWQKAGIDVYDDPLTLPAMVTARLAGRWQLEFTDSGMQGPWQYMTQWVVCSSTNGRAYCNPTADATIAQAAATPSASARIKLYTKAMTDLTSTDPGFLPLFSYPDDVIVSKKVHGVSQKLDYQSVPDAEDMWLQ